MVVLIVAVMVVFIVVEAFIIVISAAIIGFGKNRCSHRGRGHGDNAKQQL